MTTKYGLFRAKAPSRLLEHIEPNAAYKPQYRRKFKDYNMDEYFIPAMVSEFYHYFPNGWINIESRWFNNTPRYNRNYKRVSFKDFLWIEFGLINEESDELEKFDDPMYHHIIIVREANRGTRVRQSILDQRFSLNHISGGLSFNPVGEGMDRLQYCRLHRKYRRPSLDTSLVRQRHPHNILSTWNGIMVELWEDIIINGDNIAGRDIFNPKYFEVLEPL